MPIPLKGEIAEAVPELEPARSSAREALERYFGHRRFYEGQEDIVEALLAGRDTLAILPTGGGKSLCYQLPALLLPGVTVVVSPLIALMKDQVDALERRGVPATMINSTVPPEEQRTRIQELRRGRWKLVYVAPERFRQRAFTEALAAARISLVAVDEAHCISQWGHDFRPDYARLGEALELLGRPPAAAFTATATPEVREDILRQLKLRAPFIAIRGFERPNLSLNVTPCAKIKDKFARLRAIIEEHGTGIVYCSTRARAEEVYAQLREWDVPCACYHAGMSEQAREEAQELFLSKKAAVAVATNAFGMGIDRADVRFVAHFETPGSLEAYYQEAGRAGRDGGPGYCELFFNHADTRTQEFFIEGANPGTDTIRAVYQCLLERRDAENRALLSIEDITAVSGAKNEMAVGSALSVLSRGGYLRRYDVPGQRIRGTLLLQPEVAARDLTLDHAALAEKERRDRARLRVMVSFASSPRCRQRFILEYFGEDNAKDCGNCDVCRMERERGKARKLTEEEMLMVRKALSGVARCCHRRGESEWEGRFGRVKIAAMLAGSEDRAVKEAGLDRLSTYGLLRDLGLDGARALLRELEAAGLLAVSAGEYPLLRLTPRGDEIMKKGGTLRLSGFSFTAAREASSGSRRASNGGAEGRLDRELYAKLRVKRLELAEAEGVPAFAIFSNQTLEAMARLKPSTPEAGLMVRGVGEVKAKKYLRPFLEIIKAHRAG